MKYFKLLLIQGFIDCWNFRDTTNTIFNFGVKNELTDVWFTKKMLGVFFQTVFLTLINIIALILIPILWIKFFRV